VLSSKDEAGTRRAAFSEEEYDAVLEEIYEGERNAHSGKTRQIRELLYDYCKIAVNNGIRPGTEMENITWKDIEIKTQGAKDPIIHQCNQRQSHKVHRYAKSGL